MKNIILIGVAVVFAVVALGVAGIVYAYAQTPTPPFTPGQGGMMRGRGGMGGGMMRGGGMMGAQGGQMHTYMVEAVAQALDMSVDDLNAELTAGKTMWQVAEAKGLTAEQFTTLMQDARKTALTKMVEAGVITQEQADWMLSRMGGQGGTGQYGPNGCPGMGGGRMGPGGGRWNNQPAPAPSTNG